MEEFITTSARETKEKAAEFAKKLCAGDVVCLYGNLGGGKTTFVQGLAQSLGITQRIISPTFIILRSYQLKESDNLFYHADLYRLAGQGGIESTGLLEVLGKKSSIVAIEWPERMGSLLPKKRYDIFFEYINDTKRKIAIKKYE